MAIDVAFIGTGGLTVIGANEAAIMTRFEGFSTDTLRVVHIYGIDLVPDDRRHKRPRLGHHRR